MHRWTNELYSPSVYPVLSIDRTPVPVDDLLLYPDELVHYITTKHALKIANNPAEVQRNSHNVLEINHLHIKMPQKEVYSVANV